MKTQSDPLDDNEFVAAVYECTLDPSLFTHQAHVRLAFLHLKSNDLEIASELTCSAIQNFDQYVGDGKKYHHTLTMASVRVVDHFMKKCPDCDFETLVSKHPRLLSNFRDLIDQHYSKSIWNNPTAKEFFAQPDLQAF